jgi:hypothetical protein
LELLVGRGLRIPFAAEHLVEYVLGQGDVGRTQNFRQAPTASPDRWVAMMSSVCA